MIGFDLDLAQLHAPLLMVLIPLCGAGLAVLAPPRLSWAVMTVATLVGAGLAIDAASRGLTAGTQLVGTIEGVALFTDGIGIFGAALVLGAAALVCVGAVAFVRDFPQRVTPLAFGLLGCIGSGWTAALFARDLLGVFAAVEFAWLAGVALLALSNDRGALNGAMRMFVAGGVSSALMLLGVALVHRGVGATDLLHLPRAIIDAPGLAATGVGLLLLALVLKAGIAPLHFWIGAAFGRAGRLAALTLGAVSAVGALSAIVRLASYAIPAPAVGEGVSAMLAAIGAISVVVGSVQAVGARNVMRLAAYASAAQAGVVLLCASLGSPAGFAAALVQLFAMLVATLALVGGAVFGMGRIPVMDALDGLGRRAPLSSAALTAAAISFMGAPLTTGFLGRWRLVEAGVGAGSWWAAGAVIVISLAGVFYGGRLVERVYFRRAQSAYEAPSSEVWRFAGAPLLLFAILATVWGLAPSVLLRAADGAAALMAGAP